MNDAVVHSTQHMNDGYLVSIAAYLKSLPPNNAAAPYAYDDAIAKALFNGDASTHGAQIYVDRCAGCHHTDGKGSERLFPAPAILCCRPLTRRPPSTSS
jgi:alcohol dehydrogenase (quinone), cytochrome c subunit